MTQAIDIRGVTKSFGSKTAVNNLDLAIPHGSLCGFIGPNGAGKTTTIRMIMSIILADRGEIRVLGRASALESKDRIGYLPEERGLYRKMKVHAFLVYMARLKGIDSGAARAKVDWWLQRVGLADNAKKKCEELSKGMQQKVQFVAAVLHEPDLLILDEVFSGLDPVNRKLMRELIHEQHTGLNGRSSAPSNPGAAVRTIIFSTHAMYEAEQLCDRIFMIHRGHKMLDSSLREIQSRFDARTIVVESAASGRISAGFGDGLTSIPGVRDVMDQPDGLHVRLKEGTDPQRVIAALVGTVTAHPAFGGLRRIEIKRVSLEDVFIRLVESTGEQIEQAQVHAPQPAGVTIGSDL